ncbi:MAG: hypothetical protein IT495_18185 [Gammaproteobacteria bacterium]|nr:hypothetical protein [Gammaproteobacteria bacterium]
MNEPRPSPPQLPAPGATAWRSRDGAPLRRRRVWIPLAMLALAAAFVFNPALQRRILIGQLGPAVDSLSIEHVLVTPWSVHLRGAEIGWRGARVRVGDLYVRFCAVSLLAREIDVARLRLADAVIDLRRFAAARPRSEGVFPGVFASLDRGLGLVAGDIEASAQVLLAQGRSLRIALDGGAIAPRQHGRIAIEADYADPSRGLEIRADGAVVLAQRERGRFESLGLEARITLAGDALPVPEPLQLAVTLSPAQTATAIPPAVTDAQAVSAPVPEAIVVSLTAPAAGGARALVSATGRYDGATGELDGQWTLSATQALLQPYFANQDLPALVQHANGMLTLNTRGQLGLSLDGTLAVSALERVLGRESGLREPLRFAQQATVEIGGGHVRMTRLAGTLSDGGGVTVLTAALAEPMQFALADLRTAVRAPRRWLEIEVPALPLAWLNAWVPAYTLAGGALGGHFTLGTDAEGVLHLESDAPLTVSGFDVTRDGETLVRDVRGHLRADLSRSSKRLRLRLRDIVLTAGEDSLVDASASISLPAAATDPGAAAPAIRVVGAGRLNVDPLSAQPLLAPWRQAYPLPEGLTLGFEGELSAGADAVKVVRLDAGIAQRDGAELLHVTLLQPFAVPRGASGAPIGNPQGALLDVSVHDVDLAWLSPLVPDTMLTGKLARAALALTGGERGQLTLRARDPIHIEDLSLARGGTPLLDALALTVTPELRYGTDAVEVHYGALTLAAHGRTIARGAGSIRIAPGQDGVIAAAGQIDVDVGAALTQPALARAVAGGPTATALDVTARYDVERRGAMIRVDALEATATIGTDAHVALIADRGLTLRRTLEPGENRARYAVGSAILSFDALSSAALAEYLPAGTPAFAAANGRFELDSDGTHLVASSVVPLALEGVRVHGGRGAALRPFALTVNGTLNAGGDTIAASIAELSLRFENDPVAALAGELDLQVESGRAVPLRGLNATLTGDVPALLDQPTLLPGHSLTAGSLRTHVSVAADGRIESLTELSGLQAHVPLAIDSVRMPLTGAMDPQGAGFGFTAPLTGSGRSGQTDLLVSTRYAPQPGEPDLLDVELRGERFYLNDFLASVRAIAGRADSARRPGPGSAAVVTVIDDTPDAHAAWDVFPYDTRVRVQIAKLFYTDYLAFDDIQGVLEAGQTRLALTGWQAYFHASPIELDGDTRFTSGRADPYDLTLRGRIRDFDLNQFFTELVPGDKPRVEGLFGGDLDAHGQAPNLAEYRNRLLLDLRLTSREGIFRPLPPNSSLLVGASDFLGIMGEGLSYVPTSGFGVGTVSRLVSYIAAIDYDRAELHVLRDESRDLRIAQFLVQSPTISLTASGGVDYEPGVDILDSPLAMTAQLNMLGKGAAILYSMDLLHPERGPQGYWQGPEFRIWGTAANAQSNFAEIVTAASEGTLQGGLLRPLAGLIGNFRYRWFAEEIQRDADVTDASVRDGALPASAPPANHDSTPGP